MNLDPEVITLSALIETPRMLELVPQLRAEHFAGKHHAVLFEAVQRAAQRPGLIPDATVVLDELRVAGGLPSDVNTGALLAGYVGVAPVAVSVAWYAQQVLDLARRRMVTGLAVRVQETAARIEDPEILADALAGLLVEMEFLTEPLSVNDGGGRVDGLEELSAFLARGDGAETEWVIPGQLRVMERVVVVAGEGAGKSTLMRAVAVATAAGRHWLEPACRIPPQRTLMVDLENAPSMIRAKVGVMSAQLSRFGAEHEDRAWLWSRPGGINLRRAEDALLLQRVIGLVRPQLVCFGPVYKAYSDGGDRAEDSAREVIAVLDRLRERYRFALWVEHHAPLEQQGVRKLRPVGSGIWSRWPEFGVALRSAEPGDPRCTSLLFDRFRFDRDVREWPSHLHRGVRGWPWEGEWREGGMPAWLRLGTEFVEEKL